MSEYSHWSDDPILSKEYEDFENEQQPTIRRLLAKIDRARTKLIEAQNNLAHYNTNVANPTTQFFFTGFYLGGGVTAEDWDRPSDFLRVASKTKHRHLRVVGEARPRIQRHRLRLVEKDDGPQAA